METTFRSARPTHAIDQRAVLTSASIALMFLVPMFASAGIFHTYDIAMGALALEILRQFNAPFLVTEAIVICAAWQHGFRPVDLWSQLHRGDRVALLVFLAFFWVGASFTSQIAPFATLFNLTYVLHLVFMGAVLHLAVLSGPQSIDAFGKVMAWGLVAFAAIIAIKFLNPPAGRAIDTIRWQFAIPGMISVRLFGALLAPFVVLFVYLSLNDRRQRVSGIWAILAAGFVSGLLAWTGTRAGIVGAAAALGVAALWFRMEIFSKRFFIVLITCIGGAFLGMALVPYGDPDFMLFVPQDMASANAVTSGRLGWWRDLLIAYSKIPMFGAGPGASSYLLGSVYEPHIQPHNLFIQFLLNWGLIATVAALFLITRALIFAHRAARRHLDVAPYVLMGDCLLVLGLFDGTFHFPQHLMMWVAVIAMALAALRRSPA